MNNEVMSALSVMPETKEQQTVFVDKLIDSVVSGQTDPLKAEALIVNVEAVCKAYRKDKQVKELLLAKVKEGGGKVDDYNANFSVMETGVIYDYELSKTWRDLTADIEQKKEKVKAIELALRNCSEVTPFVDTTSGEIITFCPKVASETVKVVIKK